MEYVEHENIIYRGEMSPEFGCIRVTDFILDGKWQPVTPRQRTDAAHGNVMTEEEAKAFEGEEWPADAPAAPKQAAPQKS
jgi:hypothetical protein